VLEIGAGTGLNFKHYLKDARVAAIEPDLTMLKRASPRTRADASISMIAADGEDLPFKTASFDNVVSTLVFCTIPDPQAAIGEVRRVLKPGGTFHFLEHVVAEGPRLKSFQDFIDPLWSRMFAGCHPNRDTVSLFKANGFRIGKFDATSRGVLVRGTATAT